MYYQGFIALFLWFAAYYNGAPVGDHLNKELSAYLEKHAEAYIKDPHFVIDLTTIHDKNGHLPEPMWSVWYQALRRCPECQTDNTLKPQLPQDWTATIHRDFVRINFQDEIRDFSVDANWNLVDHESKEIVVPFGKIGDN